MLQCTLRQIHRERHTIPIRIESHVHGADELVYFLSGNGTTAVNGQCYSYRPGQFAFYKMGNPHDEDDPEPCDILWVHFSCDLQGLILQEGVFDDSDGKLLALLLQLRRVSLEPQPHGDLLVECCLAQVLVTAAQKQQPREAAGDRPDWDAILNDIDINGNLYEPTDFAALAAKYHYSYDRFRHLFAAHFGLSPYAFLTQRRLVHAKRLLKNSGSPITEIAFDCGFHSASQFTNIFKKYVGLTPKEYRKKHTAG